MHLTTLHNRAGRMPAAAGLRNGLPLAPRPLLNSGVDIRNKNSYHSSMKSTVSERGQVTIPKAIREQLGIRPGQVLEFQAEKGRLVAIKELPADPIDLVFGIIDLQGGTDRAIAALRGEPEGS